MTRAYLPTPRKVEEDLRRTRETLHRLEASFERLAGIYGELHDAAHSQGSSETLAPSRTDFRPSDPTGDVATSSMHAYMRQKACGVAIELRHAMKKVRWAEEPLAEAERLLQEGFAAFDPEHRQRLARLREIEAAIREHEAAS